MAMNPLMSLLQPNKQKGFTDEYGDPLGDSIQQDPGSALATFLGIDNSTGPMNLDEMQDPSVQLAGLRGTRQRELEDRMIADPSMRNKSLLNTLTGQIESDPFTGKAAQAQAAKNRQDYTTAVSLNEPTNPLAQQQAHQEQFLMEKARAEHPSQYGSGTGQTGGVDADPNLVRGLLNYSIEIPPGTNRSREPWISAIRAAAAQDPNWSPAEYENRKKVVQKFKSGDFANRSVALNQAIGHLSDLSGAIPGLENTEGMAARPMDMLRQMFTRGSNPALSAFETPRAYLSEEVGKFFHGNPSEQAAKAGAGIFSSSNAPSVNQQGVGSLAHLLKTGSEEMESSLKAGLGIPANQELPDYLKELIYHPGRQEALQGMISAAPSNQPTAAPAGGGPVVRRIR